MENIEVIAAFTKEGVFPRIIKWGANQYKILKVSLIHPIKDGNIRIYFFSVSDGSNAWKLGFNTDSLTWWIEDHYDSSDSGGLAP